MLSNPLSTLAVVVSALCAAGSLSAQDPPNLIFILADDMGTESIEGPHWGNEMGCFTTNLQTFAQQGVSFTNCRVNPNCSPTRAALMTGRSALDTGVHGVIGRYSGDNPCVGGAMSDLPGEVTNRLSLQTQERTIAEVLQDMGYYTVLVDKWHLGYNFSGEDRGMRPMQQGFNEFFDWFEDVDCNICEGYVSHEYFADRHMVCMAQKAVAAVQNRAPGQPYALFYHTITPHRRHNDHYGMTGGLMWWEIEDKTLIPRSVMAGHDDAVPQTEALRFIMNVEALDSVLVRELLGPAPVGLEVVTEEGDYIDTSNTIIFFTCDNGTDKLISSFGMNRAKNSLYEGGIRVPLIVFGAGISDHPTLPDTANPRQITHMDFFETICDIVRAPDSTRNNNLSGGAETQFPHRSMSFADAINWADPNQPPPVERTSTVVTFGNVDGGAQLWKAAMIEGPWKLICNSAGDGSYDMSEDEFYNLVEDAGEQVNLLAGVPSTDQLTAYYSMRYRMADDLPIAVPQASPLLFGHYTVDHFNSGMTYVLVAHLYWEGTQGVYVYEPDEDEFYHVAIDPNRDHDLLVEGMTGQEQIIYHHLQQQMEYRVENDEASPDVAVIDLPVSATLSQSDDGNVTPDELAVGYEDVAGGGAVREYRSLVKFDLTGTLPPGFTSDDIISAQIIMAFDQDSQLFDPNYPEINDYLDADADTGVITAHRMISGWSSDLWDVNNYESGVRLGSFDPPPHIMPIPYGAMVMIDGVPSSIRMTPMPSNTPVGFGNNEALKQTVEDWYEGAVPNNGVILIADLLPGLDGDQYVHFLRASQRIALRLTLDRRQ